MRKTEGRTSSSSGMNEKARENRWCDRHAYFVDFEACVARSKSRSFCRRCLWRWRQMDLPFPDPVSRN